MKTINLGKDPIFSIALKLAIPSMFAQFVNVLYTIIDRMFIGNIPQIGEIALAGIGVCGPIAAFLASFGNRAELAAKAAIEEIGRAHV